MSTWTENEEHTDKAKKAIRIIRFFRCIALTVRNKSEVCLMKLSRDNLHEYQKYGVDFIINNPISALMLECGLGKTITTLTAVSDLMYDYFEISKVLIIAPLRVGLSVWKQECDKWEQLKYLRCSIAIGSADERKKP